MTEHALIRSLRAVSVAATPPRGLVVGSGDDAAVFRASAAEDFVVTQDALVEGRHFARRWFTGRELGWRLAAVNLSDVAAMGARPKFALISLGVPASAQDAYLKGIQSGAARHLGKFGAVIVGGNITSTSGPLTCDMTLIGICKRGTAWPRRARAGDAIVVAGELGNASAGLAQLRGARAAAGKLVAAYKKPRPLLDVAGLLAGERSIHAAIDVSDGFSSDVIQLCESGRVGCNVEADALPVSKALSTFCGRRREDPMDRVLNGGEDYALILSVAAREADRVCDRLTSRLGISAVVAGRFRREKRVYQIVRNGRPRRLKASGWDHLRGR